jgi:hypothetical protein
VTADPYSALWDLYRRIDGTGLPVFVGGAVAAMAHGEPRSTQDIDIIVRAVPDDADRIIAAFPERDRFYVPDRSVVRAELGREGGQFNILDYTSGMKADLYVAGKDPLNAYGLAHTVERQVGPQLLRVASPTYVIAMKLRFFAMSHQDKHLRDIRALLVTCRDDIDMGLVGEWAGRAGVVDAWEDCLRREGDE